MVRESLSLYIIFNGRVCMCIANITVGELMYHTSGIPDYFNLFKANVNAPTCFDRDACVTLPTLLRVLKVIPFFWFYI